MNTDMNQYLIFMKYMGMLINYCKKNDSLLAESLVLGKFTHHLCLQSTFLVIYLYIWYLQDTVVAWARCYIMWEELRIKPFLKVVTTGNQH